MREGLKEPEGFGAQRLIDGDIRRGKFYCYTKITGGRSEKPRVELTEDLVVLVVVELGNVGRHDVGHVEQMRIGFLFWGEKQARVLPVLVLRADEAIPVRPGGTASA